VCKFVCMRVSGRRGGGGGVRVRERERKRESVCVYMCV